MVSSKVARVPSPRTPFWGMRLDINVLPDHFHIASQPGNGYFGQHYSVTEDLSKDHLIQHWPQNGSTWRESAPGSLKAAMPVVAVQKLRAALPVFSMCAHRPPCVGLTRPADDPHPIFSNGPARLGSIFPCRQNPVKLDGHRLVAFIDPAQAWLRIFSLCVSALQGQGSRRDH